MVWDYFVRVATMASGSDAGSLLSLPSVPSSRDHSIARFVDSLQSAKRRVAVPTVTTSAPGDQEAAVASEGGYKDAFIIGDAVIQALYSGYLILAAVNSGNRAEIPKQEVRITE